MVLRLLANLYQFMVHSFGKVHSDSDRDEGGLEDRWNRIYLVFCLKDRFQLIKILWNGRTIFSRAEEDSLGKVLAAQM